MTEVAAKPKSDLPVRAAAGIAMIAIAVAAVYFGGWAFRILVAVAAGMMVKEWADMHRVPAHWGRISAYLLAAFLLIAPVLLLPAQGTALGDDILIAPCVLGGCALAAGLLGRRLTLTAALLYIGLPSFALLLLNWLSYQYVFWALVVTWATDIFAYFAGRAIGGPKLAPRISPNKTWAGLGGGVAGAAAGGFLMAAFFALPMPFLYAGGFMGILAQTGDLYESWLKRRAGVKDSGSILPGHGGVFDRLDGLLPVAVATLAVAALSVPV